MAQVSIDVNIDDVLWSMNSREKQDLVDELYEDGYIQSKARTDRPLVCAAESLFNEALAKLEGKWNLLSREEEEAIMKIAKKF